MQTAVKIAQDIKDINIARQSFGKDVGMSTIKQKILMI